MSDQVTSPNYCDFAQAAEIDLVDTEAKNDGSTLRLKEENNSTQGLDKPVNNFPVQLHYMLNEIEADGKDHIVSWQVHGRCLVVHKRKEFERELLPFWFKQSKFASFQRQLNFYNFRRITKGPDRGGYYHELFLRSKPHLCHHIYRQKTKGHGPRKASAPEKEPNFYELPPLPISKPPHNEQILQPMHGLPSAASQPATHQETRPSGTSSRVHQDDMQLLIRRLELQDQVQQIQNNMALQNAAQLQLFPMIDNRQVEDLQRRLLYFEQASRHMNNLSLHLPILKPIISREDLESGLLQAALLQLQSTKGLDA